MRVGCIIGTVLFTAIPAVADDAPSAAEQAQYHKCDEAGARVSQAAGLTFDRISPMMHNIFFKKDGATDVALMCGYGSMGFSVTSDNNPFPSQAFFAIVAKGGSALTGAPVAKLIPALHKCHRLALANKDEAADGIEVGSAKVECSAFTRDGGGAILSVWTN